MEDPDRKRARREAFDAGGYAAIGSSVERETADIIARNKADHERALKAGAAAPPISTWAEVAATVDDATWDRILNDLTVGRAAAEAIRPPSGQLSIKHEEDKAA
jgi:hypothetical protein